MKTPLVLLPGLLCDDSVWAPQIAAFGRERDTLVVDFRGQDSFASMADRVLELAPERFALAGHSMGGRVALEVMGKAPQRVDRLAVLSSGAHPVAPGEPEKRAAVVALAWREGMRALAEQWIPPVLHPSRREETAFVGPMIEMWCRATPADHEAQITAALNRRDERPRLEAIRCPTLILGGADDPWAPAEQQRAIAEAIAGARLVLVPDCGHMVTLERPEAVNAELRRWLED